MSIWRAIAAMIALALTAGSARAEDGLSGMAQISLGAAEAEESWLDGGFGKTAWSDSEADRLWAEPSPDALYRRIDRFHLPAGAGRDSTWAEWHYFNGVLGPDRWVYVTLMVAG